MTAPSYIKTAATFIAIYDPQMALVFLDHPLYRVQIVKVLKNRFSHRRSKLDQTTWELILNGAETDAKTRKLLDAPDTARNP